MTSHYETDIKGLETKTEFPSELGGPFSLKRLKQDNQPELPMDLRQSCFSINKLKQDNA